jgi:hypothetical protein
MSTPATRAASPTASAPARRSSCSSTSGRNPKYKVDVLTTIEKLDEEGYIHNPVSHGVSLARMEYTFREVGDGTLYENCLIVPPNHGSWFFRKVVPDLYRAHDPATSATSRRDAISVGSH